MIKVISYKSLFIKHLLTEKNMKCKALHIIFAH